MAYQRKTRDVWEVQGFYYGEWERLTIAIKKMSVASMNR